MGKRGVQPATYDEFIARFLSKIDKTPGQGPKGECWCWTGSKNPKGYGQIRWSGRVWMANRIALQLKLGRQLTELERACHECDFPPCVRDSHLFPGTQADNLRDCRIKGRAYLKISDEDVIRIRAEYVPRKVSLGKLAIRYKVTPQQIWHIIKETQRCLTKPT